MQPTKVNLAEKLSQLTGFWQPAIVGALNGQELKVVQFEGEFVWHHHDTTDELFLVLEGAFDMQFRSHTVHLTAGEFIVVPQGTEHCPKVDQPVKVLLIERAGTLNTGSAQPSAFTHAADVL